MLKIIFLVCVCVCGWAIITLNKGGAVGKAIALDAESVGFKFKSIKNNLNNHIEYFLATVSQVCIQHDELGWLVDGLTQKL